MAKYNKLTPTDRHQGTGHGKRLTLAEKALILARKDMNESASQVSKQYGVHHSTVSAIWKDKKLGRIKEEVRVVKEFLADKFTIATDAGLTRVLETIGDASVSQAAMTTGIMFDKMRLLNNQSTQNHSLNGYISIINKAGV